MIGDVWTLFNACRTQRHHQVLVTHASGLALMTLISGTSDPRGPEIYVDNADPFGMFVTVNLTMFMLVVG